MPKFDLTASNKRLRDKASKATSMASNSVSQNMKRDSVQLRLCQAHGFKQKHKTV